MAKYTDEHNPDLILQSICTDMLAQAARGELDLNALARKELANRGVDWHGHWVGFEKASRLSTCYPVVRANGQVVAVQPASEEL